MNQKEAVEEEDEQSFCLVVTLSKLHPPPPADNNKSRHGLPKILELSPSPCVVSKSE